ncbi:hypothetical protein HY407_04510 [Candidatus Gottesmanbacteria bacterium]|nr:hypothetical protein [Candidatus Gottesmanbacteria bacterium]
MTKEKLEAAYKLLHEESTNRAKFEQIRTLVKGINPNIDKILESCSKALSDIEKLQKGEIIEFSSEHLPENSEEEKNRKKAILLLIKNYKSLSSEVERVKNELEKSEGKSNPDKLQNITKLLATPKGIFGLVTVAAIIVASILVINKNKTPGKTNNVLNLQTSKIQVIDVNGKKVPVSELKTSIGSECMSSNREVEHYHAKNGTSAQVIDGSDVSDPGGCGFGKVEEIKIEEIEK